MTAAISSGETGSRLARLLTFLDADPDNLILIADAASTAYEEREFTLAGELLDRYANHEPLTAELQNLRGLTAIATQQFDEAITGFEALRMSGNNNPDLRFNLAWALAMTRRYEEAAELLDEEVMAISPRAPALKIQMLHHLEKYDDALALGETLAQAYPDNHPLMGALATLAMDADRIELARFYAGQGSDSAEGLVALGMFALDEQNEINAAALFERALEKQPDSPRAWIGKGLALVAAGKAGEGSKAIDHGAEIFEDHLGSWIASGWTHFMTGSIDRAGESFQRSVSIDPNFAEGHGGLAVYHIASGNIDRARQAAEIALRLDRRCLGAALAQILLLEQEGKTEAAARIREIAMSMPVGPEGKTLFQSLAGIGVR